MNEERSFERFVADNVAGTSQGIPLPDGFYDDMHSFATTTRQRPEWLALIKESPMRSNSQVAVGSPTVRVAAIAVAPTQPERLYAASQNGVHRTDDRGASWTPIPIAGGGSVQLGGAVVEKNFPGSC